MKKGFTLVEMLVVVAVLVTLMGIVFRLSSISASEEMRITTVVRLQKLENCVSGYYAAFGGYPPVPIQGSRDIFMSEDGRTREKRLVWRNIERACRAQSVACYFPFAEDQRDRVRQFAEEIQSRTSSGDWPNYANSANAEKFLKGFTIGSADDFVRWWDETDWQTVQIFKFGLMSFLLPRYLVMMSCDREYFNGARGPSGQWDANNDAPCDPFTGNANFDQTSSRAAWRQMQENFKNGTKRQLAQIANIPTQAVTARWLPNLASICSSCLSEEVLGVQITDDASSAFFYLSEDKESYPPTLEIHAPGPDDSAGGNLYILNTITVRDGYNNDFYYYSAPPHQSYTLWSAGRNGRTFPPWLSRAALDGISAGSEGSGSAADTVAKWTEDDIMHMSNN